MMNQVAPPLKQSSFIPAEAGIQAENSAKDWVPASAGTNGIRGNSNSAHLVLVAALGLPDTGAGASGTITLPDSGPLIAR